MHSVIDPVIRVVADGSGRHIYIYLFIYFVYRFISLFDYLLI